MDEKSLLQIAAMGGVMGLGHVLSPDHLSALATLSAGGGVEAFRLGVRWGLGTPRTLAPRDFGLELS